MRKVDYDHTKIELPADWEVRVSALKEELANEPDSKKRKELIRNNSDLWSGSIKNQLSKLFNYKCWYTESPQAGTDVDVDHFRPKGAIAELKSHTPPHSGYWWLAFELSNYRYSCIVANRRRRDFETSETGGKGDKFPIFNEDKRAWSPDADYEEELPVLLDPCKASDVKLLLFKEDGEATPRFSVDDKPQDYERARQSIEYYHINHTDFKRARLLLRDEMENAVKNANKYYKKLYPGDAAIHHAYEEALLTIRKLCDKDSPYSGFCLAYFEKYKHLACFEGILN